MRKQRFRNLPPLIVSLIVAAIFFIGAIGSISEGLQAEEAAVEPEVTESSAELFTETIVIRQEAPPEATVRQAEQEETQGSLIQSRDWGVEDSEILLKIAMAEAEGESTEGKALVMLVVLNRVWSKDFPGTIEEVVFQPGQFSTVAEGGRYWTTEPSEDCYKALELVEKGWDESRGALYFESCEGTSWHERHLEFLHQVGKHRFYK